MLEQEKVQGRVLEQLEVHMASVQETATQHRAHQPGRERTGGQWGQLFNVSSRRRAEQDHKRWPLSGSEQTQRGNSSKPRESPSQDAVHSKI